MAMPAMAPALSTVLVESWDREVTGEAVGLAVGDKLTVVIELDEAEARTLLLRETAMEFIVEVKVPVFTAVVSVVDKLLYASADEVKPASWAKTFTW